MQTRKLGHTGVEVSTLCLGTMFLGTKQDQTTSYRILDHYVAAGGSFLDTANIYAHWVAHSASGESETLLGNWMRECGNRSRMFIASKVGFSYPGVDKVLHAKVIEEECNKSLKRMNIDVIDLYYAHVDDRMTPLEETMEAFDRLVKAGKVRFIGASNYLAWRLEEARWISQNKGWADFCCIQQHYTYLPLRPGTNVSPQLFGNDDLLDYCNNRDITMLAYGVLQGGAYTRGDRSFAGKFISADNDKRLEALRAVAQESGMSGNQVIIRWMLQSSPAVLPLIAASDEAQLEENVRALDGMLSPEQMERLNTAGTK